MPSTEMILGGTAVVILGGVGVAYYRYTTDPVNYPRPNFGVKGATFPEWAMFYAMPNNWNTPTMPNSQPRAPMPAPTTHLG